MENRKGLRDKEFLFGSEQAEKSVLYTALKSTTTYGIFRFSLRLENRMATLKHKYKISIGVSSRNIYKNWRIFVKFGRRLPVQPDCWQYLDRVTSEDSKRLSNRLGYLGTLKLRMRFAFINSPLNTAELMT
ncbi:MAG: hypothetical protein CL388_00050 [Acidiferrobacteraceae bacterium]|nr:hypothetical protein [Acidiferrobacteraceae bacterium]MDP6808456.1 hypothetical protein [Desulfobacterales bacterium]